MTIIQLFWIITIASWVSSILLTFIFYKTLSKADLETITEAAETDQDHTSPLYDRVAKHTYILACIIYMLDYSFFVNSAILAALYLKEWAK